MYFESEVQRNRLLFIYKPLPPSVKKNDTADNLPHKTEKKRNNGKQMHNQNMQKSFFPTKRKKAIVRHGLADVKFIFDPKKECRKHRIDII